MLVCVRVYVSQSVSYVCAYVCVCTKRETQRAARGGMGGREKGLLGAQVASLYIQAPERGRQPVLLVRPGPQQHHIHSPGRKGGDTKERLRAGWVVAPALAAGANFCFASLPAVKFWARPSSARCAGVKGQPACVRALGSLKLLPDQ